MKRLRFFQIRPFLFFLVGSWQIGQLQAGKSFAERVEVFLLQQRLNLLRILCQPRVKFL